ncbi:MAG: hypothetical protein PWR09_1075 [Archaeoglobi archaeon]|nr:hypothetical protein [Archaeoglobi archaeon]
MGHSSTHHLWGISPSFPGLSPTRGQVVHVLLSRAPRAEPSRLAWLSRTPIAVASGRINQGLLGSKRNWWVSTTSQIHRPAKHTSDGSSQAYRPHQCLQPGKPTFIQGMSPQSGFCRLVADELELVSQQPLLYLEEGIYFFPFCHRIHLEIVPVTAFYIPSISEI